MIVCITFLYILFSLNIKLNTSKRKNVLFIKPI